MLNGTGVKGKAKAVAKELRKQGYIVEQVGNAETSDYATTTVQYDPDWDTSAKTLIYAANADGDREGQEAGPDDEPDRRHRLDVGRPVVISDITSDYTANVNTGDENYCAS